MVLRDAMTTGVDLDLRTGISAAVARSTGSGKNGSSLPPRTSVGTVIPDSAPVVSCRRTARVGRLEVGDVARVWPAAGAAQEPGDALFRPAVDCRGRQPTPQPAPVPALGLGQPRLAQLPAHLRDPGAADGQDQPPHQPGWRRARCWAISPPVDRPMTSTGPGSSVRTPAYRSARSSVPSSEPTVGEIPRGRFRTVTVRPTANRRMAQP